MTSASARPLLFLDSGIGGLTIADVARAALPAHPQIYVADYAGFPYGMKSEAEIVARLPALLSQLAERFNPAIMTIACNTASTISLDAVRAAVNVPIVGTVPAIKPASELTKSGVIGVLGTQATVRQPYVANLARRFAPDAHIIHHGGHGLVTLAENKLRGETVSRQEVETAIEKLRADARFDEMDVLVMSCTHFPLLRDELALALPQHCTLIDGAQGIARRIATLLEQDNALRGPSTDNGCENLFVTTRDINAMRPYAPALGKRGFAEIVHFPFEMP